MCERIHFGGLSRLELLLRRLSGRLLGCPILVSQCEKGLRRLVCPHENITLHTADEAQNTQNSRTSAHSRTGSGHLAARGLHSVKTQIRQLQHHSTNNRSFFQRLKFRFTWPVNQPPDTTRHRHHNTDAEHQTPHNTILEHWVGTPPEQTCLHT